MESISYGDISHLSIHVIDVLDISIHMLYVYIQMKSLYMLYIYLEGAQVSELQDTALESNIRELSGRVDGWFSERGGPDAAREKFREAFAIAFARAVRLGASWLLVPCLEID